MPTATWTAQSGRERVSHKRHSLQEPEPAARHPCRQGALPRPVPGSPAPPPGHTSLAARGQLSGPRQLHAVPPPWLSRQWGWGRLGSALWTRGAQGWGGRSEVP